MPASGLYLRAVQLMSRGYGELDEDEKAAEYARRIDRALSNGHFGARPVVEAKNGRKAHAATDVNAPLFSVIIPTQPSDGAAGVSGRAGTTNDAAGHVRGDCGGRWFDG